MGTLSMVVPKVGWGFCHLWSMEGDPAHGRGWDWMGFEVASNSNHSMIL